MIGASRKRKIGHDWSNARAPATVGAASLAPNTLGRPVGPLEARMREVASLNALPVVRNLLITHAYFELSEALGGLIGLENANWCTFATWASKTAGRFIRKEDCPELLRGILGVAELESFGPESRIEAPPSSMGLFSPPTASPGVLELPERILDEVSKLIAQGNLIVFSEIGPMIARFVDLYGDDAASTQGLPDDAMLLQVKSGLVSGPPERGGQDMLMGALDAYHAALLEADPKARAELVLIGNACIGLHEQARLQPFILASLNTPIRRILRQLTERRLPAIMMPAVERVMRPVADRASNVWRELATKQMMTLYLPNETLRLGQPPSEERRLAGYPPRLAQPSNPALVAMLDRFGARLSTPRATGATDWSNLNERMGFIVDLFRARQCDATLRAAPFSAEQLTAIMGGRVPTSPGL